jgi:hypothetical protein
VLLISEYAANPKLQNGHRTQVNAGAETEKQKYLFLHKSFEQ